MHAIRPLEERFAESFDRLVPDGAGTHLLVAVSGGVDSVALLDLLRARARAVPLRLTVAHLDHAMREGSAADAAWVRELCTRWDIPLVEERLDTPPASEEAARDARYAFLRSAARRCGADLIATAHTADDQAETVLFRAVRGTGLRGLAGIRARTPHGVIRPLLTFWRDEVVAYAERRRLEWREDPSNLDVRFARNRIRQRILPEIEAEIAPGARRNLVALARLAAEAEAVLERLAREARRELMRREGADLVLARDRLQAYDPAVASRVLRSVLRELGCVPGRAGTRAALQFITDAPSGREMRLPGGVRIAVEFREARLSVPAGTPADETVEIAGPGAMPPRRLMIGGAGYEVEVHDVADAATGAEGWRISIDPSRAAFPLQLRGWRPGDRATTDGGTKSLKKLFLEARIPRSRRRRLPVLVDAGGRVLWVAGVNRRFLAAPRGERHLTITIVND